MDFQDTLGPWMGKTMKLMDIYFHDYFKQNNIDISKKQWIILKVLSDEDGRVQNDLAFVTNRDKTSLTRLLSGMEKKNLVARIPSKLDKRINHIHLTKNGNLLYQKTKPIIQQLLNNIQEPLTETEIRDTIRVMQKLKEHLITKIDSCDSN
ncbi:MarR family winged helix-turn-helix transcriptional regulator [Urechidicola vernalis]|uniref:MarR family winged helix-turn-helix transcriptional regulator n=1 Tax=Urechidicola vernalis TaxID=3075600 RepID=A0ABU2Y2A2_9FLAO|nr:MarR family winged helix-turn-helix transcriptional regulator [Urechidicola sp. P050]MDT0551936.1 MarR family winged helix-turn-helix transcriptional regulator [Urechidicola sp. P050]